MPKSNPTGSRQPWKAPVKARMTNQDKRKEVSLEMDALGSGLKEKTHTWNKSCRESAKRETELYKMIEITAKDEKQEDNERTIIKKTLKQLCEEEDEADEARALLEEMQQNVDEAEAKVAETRRRLFREINECMHSWDQELGRPHNIMDKVWQMMQSNDTKTMNLNEELMSKAQQTGWKGSTKNNKVLVRKRRRR